MTRPAGTTGHPSTAGGLVTGGPGGGLRPGGGAVTAPPAPTHDLRSARRLVARRARGWLTTWTVVALALLVLVPADRGPRGPVRQPRDQHLGVRQRSPRLDRLPSRSSSARCPCRSSRVRDQPAGRPADLRGRRRRPGVGQRPRDGPGVRRGGSSVRPARRVPGPDEHARLPGPVRVGARHARARAARCDDAAHRMGVGLAFARYEWWVGLAATAAVFIPYGLGVWALAVAPAGVVGGRRLGGRRRGHRGRRVPAGPKLPRAAQVRLTGPTPSRGPFTSAPDPACGASTRLRHRVRAPCTR